MTDAALENAHARRKALSKKLDTHIEQMTSLREAFARDREEMDKVTDFIRTWYEMAGTQPPAQTEQTKNIRPVAVTEVVERRPPNPNRRFVTLKCIEYIREAGRPLSRAELFDKLNKNGVVLNGKNPEMVLSTMLWRTDDLIKRLKGGGYWPVEDKLPTDHADDFEDLLS